MDAETCPILFSRCVANEAERIAWMHQMAVIYRGMKKRDPSMRMHVSAELLHSSFLSRNYPIEYRISFMRTL